MTRAYVGTSGWNYKHWSNGAFYPPDVKPPDWLKFFAAHFETVEINNSFYRLPTETAFQNWRSQVPEGFIFSVKASRFLTHIKRLKDPEGPLDLFFGRARFLKNRLGPVLFQLPPRFKVDIQRLQNFLAALNTHNRKKNLRFVIEVRDPTWLVPPVFELLRRNRVALCFADWRDMPVTEPVTADFVYIRRHYGRAGGGNYSRKDLNRDVDQILGWLSHKLGVYVYFNNDMGGHALRNARYVKKQLAKNHERNL